MTDSVAPASSRRERVLLWTATAVLLALSAFLIPGSIWGTSGDSPLSSGRVYWVSVPILLAGLGCLWLAIRAQRRERARRS